MFAVALSTLRGVLRDRVFHGLAVAALLFLFIPLISLFSMRQVTELAMNLSLALSSSLLFLLAIFLGGTALWKDIDRRYIFSVLGMPLERRSYLLGKFFGIALFLLLATLLLAFGSTIAILMSSLNYQPPRGINWTLFSMAFSAELLKVLVVVGVGFLFSTISTSFFLPIFGTLAIFFCGAASQQVYDYLHSPGGQNISQAVKYAADALYYILPNIQAFNLKLVFIYNLGYPLSEFLITCAYGGTYIAVLLGISILLFSQRQFQ